MAARKVRETTRGKSYRDKRISEAVHLAQVHEEADGKRIEADVALEEAQVAAAAAKKAARDTKDAQT